MDTRSRINDGMRNRIELYFLTHFGFIWPIIQRIGPLNRCFNRLLIRRAISKTKPRPHQYSMFADYTCWPSLTDRRYSGRHMAAASAELYGSGDRIEFYVGLFAEDVRPNSALPGLIGRMVGVDEFSQALTNPLLSANVFNPTTFSKKGWEIINETNSLSQILHRNLCNAPGTYKIKMTQNGEEVPPPATTTLPPPHGAAARRPAMQTESVFADAIAESGTTATAPDPSERGLFIK